MEGQEARAAEFVGASRVPGVREGGHRDLGDVAGVDERFGRVAGREDEFAGQDRVQEERLVEVLEEPTGAQDRPVRAGGLKGAFRAPGAFLAARRQQDQAARPLPDREVGELAYGFGCAGHPEVGVVRDVGGPHPVQRGVPRRRVVPGERRRRGARAEAERQALCGEEFGNPAAGLAGSADDENGLLRFVADFGHDLSNRRERDGNSRERLCGVCDPSPTRVGLRAYVLCRFGQLGGDIPARA
ncbi:hypothetical protein GCM10020221_07430 [Streptomyces thioluteus]|uniref:Uncharacterized protein n=1 Tax=Streptomyces thioluteus TaxID=66431 RepID=A0ABN3WHZ4_STRTU